MNTATDQTKKKPLLSRRFLIITGVLFGFPIIIWYLVFGPPGEVDHRPVRYDSTISQLEVAINFYYTDYSRCPNPFDATTDMTIRSSVEIMNILMAVDGPGNVGHEKNPRRIVYVELLKARNGKRGIETEGVDKGKLKDPWGEMYFIRLDYNHDDQIDGEPQMPRPSGMDPLTPLRPKRIAVWSAGKDRQVGGDFSKDDVYTY